MNSPMIPSRRVLLEAVVLVLVAVAVGLSLNPRLVMNAFMGRNVVSKKPPIAASVQKFPQPVDYEELDSLIAAGDQLVDARDHHLYATAHLPGAISLPLGEVGQSLKKFKAQIPLETPLILYCNGFGCPDSFDLGVRLIAAGYLHVQVYEGGFPEWRDRGRPLEAGEGR
ncbi:rhodanese-like domain-containing protein [Geopsychrobacter electrodiphilus]|uniref:rhodanese-like domain-containing protein n=1 Tax=Geopsychrobacter electrodiphilus TaxID=225196 RepID=UPI0003763D4E|nr:rhodanese-like domain-containing protein [Geopsychrobacter electrodiphilus]